MVGVRTIKQSISVQLAGKIQLDLFVFAFEYKWMHDVWNVLRLQVTCCQSECVLQQYHNSYNKSCLHAIIKWLKFQKHQTNQVYLNNVSPLGVGLYI